MLKLEPALEGGPHCLRAGKSASLNGADRHDMTMAP